MPASPTVRFYTLEIRDGSRDRVIEGFAARGDAEREATRLMVEGDKSRVILVWAEKSGAPDEIVTRLEMVMRPVLRIQKNGAWREHPLSGKRANPGKSRRRAKR